VVLFILPGVHGSLEESQSFLYCSVETISDHNNVSGGPHEEHKFPCQIRGNESTYTPPLPAPTAHTKFQRIEKKIKKKKMQVLELDIEHLKYNS
jgi:hypothetical protein